MILKKIAVLLMSVIIAMGWAATAMATDAAVHDDARSIPTEADEQPITAEEELARAVGALQSGITFSIPEFSADFPMRITVDEETGISLVVSGNKGIPNSVSSITATFHAEAGQVLEQNYRTSSEFGYDELIVTLNGEVIKRLSGQTTWTKAAYVIPETGDYTAELRYVKDENGEDGEDCAWINTFMLVSAEEGAAVLDSLPAYWYSEEAGLSVYSEGSREFVLEDMMSLQLAYGGNVKCYAVSTEGVEIQAHISRDIDPDNACVTLNNANEYIRLRPYAYADGFFFELNWIDTLESTGRSSTVVRLFPAVGETQAQAILLFAGEKGVEEYIRSSYSDPSRVRWRYADEEEWRTVSEKVFVAPDLDGRPSAMYRFSAYSMSGSFLVGVKIELASETDTYEVTTNLSGGILAELPAAEYHIRVTNLGETDTASCSPDVLGPEGGHCFIFVTMGE